jgi:hypothetical protein
MWVEAVEPGWVAADSMRLERQIRNFRKNVALQELDGRNLGM